VHCIDSHACSLPTPAHQTIECSFLLWLLKSLLSRHATAATARASLRPTQSHCCSSHYELHLISISVGLLGDLGSGRQPFIRLTFPLQTHKPPTPVIFSHSFAHMFPVRFKQHELIKANSCSCYVFEIQATVKQLFHLQPTCKYAA
jgi:hypothetical protein